MAPGGSYIGLSGKVTVSQTGYDISTVIDVTYLYEVINRTSLPLISTNCLVWSGLPIFTSRNKSDDVISEETAYWVERILTAVIIPLLCILGTPANLLNCIVFYTQGLGDRVNVTLFCLAIVDLVFVVQSFVHFLQPFVSQFIDYKRYGDIYGFILNNDITGFMGFGFASFIISTFIAVERCVCVVDPFRARQILNVKTTLAIIVCPSLLVVGGYFVLSRSWTYICVLELTSNTRYFTAYLSTFYFENKTFIDILDTFVYGTTLPWACVIGVGTTTAVTTFRLQQATLWRNKTVAAARAISKEAALTKMLIGTSCLFVVCVTPNIAFRATRFLVSEFRSNGRFHNTWLVCNTILALAGCVNATFNFFVYLRLGTKFKETLRELFARSKSDERVYAQTSLYNQVNLSDQSLKA